MRLFICFILLFHSFSSLLSQTNTNIPLGVWRTHLPTSSTTTISLFKNKIYTGSPISSFTYDLSDNHLAPLSRIDGLTSSNISVIRFSETAGYGIIGYMDGNIDIIQDGIIKNFDDVFRSSMAGTKNINNITLYKDLAFLACDFGVTIINISRNEIVESWLNLSTGGMQNKVYACVLNEAKDSVFLATENGILSAPYGKPGINLMDFANWHSYTNISTTNSRCVGQLNNNIYAAVSGDGVYLLTGNTWQNIGISLTSDQICWNLTTSQNKLLLSAGTKVYAISSPTSFSTVINNADIADVHDATYDPSGNIWVADSTRGLYKFNGQDLIPYGLNGPLNTSTFNLYYYNNIMLANCGGYDNTFFNLYRAHGFYEFQSQNQWMNYAWNSNYPPNTLDNINATYNPFDDTLYVGHFGYGLICHKKPDTFIKYTKANSPLTTDYVTGLDTDKKGTVWLANYGVSAFQPAVFSKDKSGNWTSYTLSNRQENRSILQLKIDSSGNKWMRYGNNGLDNALMVFNDQTGQERYFTTSSAGGNLPSNKINCIEVDKKGVVWIGSDQGLSAFYEPSKAFTGSFSAPIYNGFGVLFDKSVTCIKTDGGNRKWVGTTEGLWLFEDDFSKFIHYFTVENSPLYSNNIIDVDIHDVTGEVFIATDKGIISYRGDATADHTDFSQAKIFPNPVRPGFSGVITIEGLQDNVRVKITDMQGMLYYETPTHGGTATWNLINYAGVKAESGMYLVFATTNKGEEKFVGKIAIIQ
ncbi:MAG: type IX secretion system anionic LPS delivery protein PorZ [Cytophaga sp.]|uniref:type IX secretion system anionic LPS delivery protein PorZ n=1 Tax=Cytophaga sp. TaxID=29535 RepID=UPI003F7E49A3